MKKFKAGFTLIELLIVIALLGSLAVGLLAALDPFEQLKKGTDTGTRNTASEVHGAAIRFYALKSNLPWCDATDGTLCASPAGAGVETGSVATGRTLTQLNGGTATTTPYHAVTQLAESGELKSNFIELAGTQMGLIFVTGKNDPPTIIVCYKPVSKAFQSDKNTKYNIDGTAPWTGAGTCRSAGGTTDCYWCIQ